MAPQQFLDKNGLDKYHEGVVDALNKKSSTKNGVYYIVGISVYDGVWIGVLNGLEAYYDGLTISYKINVVGGASITTLNINDLGAKTIYRDPDTILTTEYDIGSVISLTYINSSTGGCWMINNDNSNNADSPITTSEIDEIFN